MKLSWVCVLVFFGGGRRGVGGGLPGFAGSRSVFVASCSSFCLLRPFGLFTLEGCWGLEDMSLEALLGFFEGVL